MIRTNQTFLEFTEQLYEEQKPRGDIFLKNYSKGEMLFHQDEASNKVMLIKEGITKCFIAEPNDREYIIEFLGKGEIVGEVEFIKKILCLCNVEAMTDVSVYTFAIPYFQNLLDTDLQLNKLLRDVFTERIINTSSRASFQQLYTAEHSLSKLLSLMANKKSIFRGKRCQLI